MEGGPRPSPEVHPIPFPGGETEAKQKTRPGGNQAEPARSPLLEETEKMAKPVNPPDRLVLEVTGHLLRLA